MEIAIPQKKQSRLKLSARLRKSGELPRNGQDAGGSGVGLAKNDRRRTITLQTSANGTQAVTFDDPKRPKSPNAPPSRGEDNSPTLALPVYRLSESSRSDGSSGDRRLHGSTTTSVPVAAYNTTSFFRIPRRKQKQPAPLFPISHLQRGTSADASASSSSLAATTAESVRASTSSRMSGFGGQETPTPSRPSSGRDGPTPPAPSPARAIFNKANNISPATALFRPGSRNSGQSSPTRGPLNLRGRSSTLSSVGRDSMDDRLAPPTTRTSSSTGRKSFGDLLGLSRLRQNSDGVPGRQGSLTPATPGSNTSKNNSLQLPRESIVLPERREDDTPAKYLGRLEEVVSRSVIASALSKGTDTFSQAVLRSYMRGFKFFGDPMDMAIRKLLMEAELPRETQQIDRCLQSFANRYHECNPGVYASPDQAYFIAFSLLILHTDVFNKNNKHKMQKADYLRNTRGEGIFDEILEVFYDNISYTPFIHVEDDFDINGERIVAHKSRKKSIFPNGAPDVKKSSREPIDPYTLIIDSTLDILRPNLKDVMHLDDHYSYQGTAKSLNLKELQKTFFKTGVLQIVSARSRPDAFMSEKTATNPEDAHPGIVDIKITKVGLLWRKDAKKKKTRSPWQEWGAILTGAQLYFFRNTTWVKSLMHQYETHIKHGHDGIPIIFKPPLDQFRPDELMSTDGAVALLDSTYKKHKHAFTYVRHGGFEEVMLADNEDEMNDWLAKLNYAAAFRTSGVRMRGLVGGAYEGQNRRAIRRLDSDLSHSVQTPTGEVTITRSRIDHKMAQDILAARREIMHQRVADANEKLQHEEKKLETQLRNARHLQILAPIPPKTREQMLLSAARMAAQLKWTRMEMWRVRCHRDILLMDLEEEKQLMGNAPENIVVESSSPEKPGLTRETSNASTAVQRSPRSPGHLPARRDSATASATSDGESPLSDVFQTPPTTATAATFHKHQNSWELPMNGLDSASVRKASVSSVVSSGGRSIMATPPRNVATSTPAKEGQSVEDHHEDVDAGERNLLKQAGLLVAVASRSSGSKVPPSAIEEGEPAETREYQKNGASADKLDKNKIRRSLQRTLRESAGHLSHHRSRRGKDSASSGATDEIAREPDVLSRGSGSFVVHGKKASVITFGGDLQSISPDERLRQRKAQQAAQQREEAASPASGESGLPGDFRIVLQSQNDDRERRGSAASASTATARSFRDLHRKYSSAQAAKSGSTLAIPSDEDSDAAISLSDGRRTPLVPTEEADEESEREEDEGVDDQDLLSPPMSAGTQVQFFTPEPPASPALEATEGDEETRELGNEGERLPSPTLQVVSA